MKKLMLVVATVIVVLTGIMAILGLGVFDLVANEEDNGFKNEETRNQKVPRVISKIKTLEIKGVKIVYPNTPSAVVQIEIKNNSRKSIVGYSVESGDKKDVANTTVIGTAVNPPTVYGRPFKRFFIDFRLDDVIRKSPIRIVSVIYSDGSQDGENKDSIKLRKKEKRIKEKLPKLKEKMKKKEVKQ